MRLAVNMDHAGQIAHTRPGVAWQLLRNEAEPRLPSPEGQEGSFDRLEAGWDSIEPRHTLILEVDRYVAAVDRWFQAQVAWLEWRIHNQPWSPEVDAACRAIISCRQSFRAIRHQRGLIVSAIADVVNSGSGNDCAASARALESIAASRHAWSRLRGFCFGPSRSVTGPIAQLEVLAQEVERTAGSSRTPCPD